MDSSDSLQIDEHLARLLAAYDQGIEGGDGKAPTIGVTEVPQPQSAPRPREEVVQPLSGSAANEGSVGDLLPDAGRTPITNWSPRPITTTPGPPNGIHRIGRFELRRQLGKGGCGIVFLAFDPKLEREVALKIPRPEMLLSPDARRRLVREALAAAEFDHPNLVSVYETGEIGPICFIATAFCPGQTLGEWLDKQAFPVPVRQAARLVAIIAEAVQHAHDRGVLHRDLKPNNVILQATKDDPQEQEAPPGSCQLRGDHYIPRVVDFGLAKLIERGGPSETNTRQILGTPKYMAPEQAQARHADVGPTVDVYALGVILYEMLAGCAPYEGASDVEVLRQSIDGKLKQPRHIRSEIPRDLEAICLKAMERLPAKRYRTAIDLSDDLRRFLDGKPTIARPLKWPGRAVRWLRRNDQVVALAVVTVVALVLFAVGAWFMDQTRQLKDDQNRVAEEQALRTQSDQHRDYARNVHEAYLAWRGGNARATTEAIDRARRLASTGGQSLDFALRYLDTLAKRERTFVICPEGPVTALAVSPDAKRLASGHSDGTLALWDRASGQRLASVKAHDREITHVAFAQGGSRLVTVGGMHKTTETGLGWAVDAEGRIAPAPDQHRVIGRSVTCLAVSPEGDVVYTGGVAGELRKVHLQNSQHNRTEQRPQREAITAIAVAANGASILVGTGGGKVCRFTSDLKTDGSESGHHGPVTALLLREGPEFKAGSPAGISMVETDGWFRSTRGRVHWIVPLAGGFAANESPGRVLLWTGRWHELATGDDGVVHAGATTQDGKTLFTAGDDGIIRSWNKPEDLRECAAWAGIASLAIGVHPDGHRVAVSSPYSFRDSFGLKEETHLSTEERGFAAIRIPKEGPTQVVEFRERAAVIRETQAGKIQDKASFLLPDDSRPVSAHFSSDGNRLAIGDDRGRMFVWNVQSKALLANIDCGHRSRVGRVVLSDDGKLIAGSGGKSILICSVDDPTARLSVTADEQSVFRFTPLGDRLVSAGQAGVVRVWLVADGHEESTLFGHVGRVSGLAVSPDGRTLVSGGASGEVKFWDLRTGHELMSFRRHSRPVTVIEFSANGNLLVTAGDGQLAMWEARD